MNSKSYQESISKTFRVKLALKIAEILLLILIGVVGVLLHAKFRIPLKLPGHWGLVYMALLLSGRMFSNIKFAGSLSSIGASLMLLFPLGFKDPLMPLLFLIPGFLIDIYHNAFIKIKIKINFILLGIVCGLAYATIPALRIVFSLTTGWFYGSFVNGYIYPLVLHFVFGALGGMVAMGIFYLIKIKK